MMDVHAHSYHSDGSDAPAEIVRKAKEIGLTVCAVTDHDCVDGVEEALRAGEEFGIAVLSGLEMDVSCDVGEGCEAHVLGFGFDVRNAEIRDVFARLDVAREARNAEILGRLRSLGAPVEIRRDERGAMISRAHIADSLVKAGHVATIDEAFARYLGRHGAARVDMERVRAGDYIEMIHRAGGVCVIAHPGLLHADMGDVIARLACLGLDGIEVYYPAHKARQIVALRDQAKALGLWITAGSDYHGSYRSHVALGAMSEWASFDPMVGVSTERMIAIARRAVAR